MSSDTPVDPWQDSLGQEAILEPLDTALCPAGELPLRLPVAISVAFIALADWLFWGCPRGWTIGAYGLLLTGTLLVWERGVRPTRMILLVTLAVVLLCLQCFVEPNCLVVTCGLAGLGTLAIILREGWSPNAVTWLRRWTLMAATGWLSFFRDLARSRRGRANAGLPRRGSRLVQNWSLPILLAAVFLVLFATANPVISAWLEDAWRFVRNLLRRFPDRLPSGWRVLLWAAVALGVWTLLRFRSGPPASMAASIRRGEVGSAVPGGHFPEPALIVRCLVLFNLLFAFQTGLDVYYLWGGGVLPKGLTYARYAHRGAYPLVAAAILAALFVLAAFRAGPADRSMRTARRLVYLWLMQNLFLVVSATWRLRLYVDAYTLTRWRVAAAIWMLLVFCGILWILVRVLATRSNLWLININTVTAVLVLYACCFVNFDGRIAGFNVRHCREFRGSGPRIDLDYLSSLGPDTLPALRELAVELRESPKGLAVRKTIRHLQGDLHAELSSWRGWTWRRQILSQLDYPILPLTETQDLLSTDCEN